ncbi:hypothetical protein KSF78_0005070 [Schistosoma japonicum]|nr:hypothetical protein KSF78_0005070 [Schistosoma japonicum]
MYASKQVKEIVIICSVCLFILLLIVECRDENTHRDNKCVHRTPVAVDKSPITADNADDKENDLVFSSTTTESVKPKRSTSMKLNVKSANGLKFVVVRCLPSFNLKNGSFIPGSNCFLTHFVEKLMCIFIVIVQHFP